MAKAPIDAVNTIHDALQGLEPADQLKALQAAVMLLGISLESTGATAAPRDIGTNASGMGPQSRSANQKLPPTGVGTASDYFRTKDPQGLMEVLAVAARYRELTEEAEVHTKEDLDAVFRAARRNASKNFSRDLRNAKKQQYFNSGPDVVLSHYGQSYVDALPDREAARAIPRPKSVSGSKKKKRHKNGG